MTYWPYVPVVASAVMSLHAVALSPHTVPKSEASAVALLVTALLGTQADAATMFSQSVALGVGGSLSLASHRFCCTAGHARGTLVGEYKFMLMPVSVALASTAAIAVASA